MFPFLVALQFLTRLPISLSRAPSAREMVLQLVWYPAVGWLFGAWALALWFAFHHFGSTHAPLYGWGIVVGWVLLSGGFHLDGLADTADGLGSGRRGAEAGAIMKDSRIGSMGAVGLVLVLGGKWLAVSELVQAQHGWALLLAPALGRWFGVLVAFLGQSPPWVKSGLGQQVVGKLGWKGMVLSSVVALGPLAWLAWPWGWVAPLLASAVVTLGLYRKVQTVVGGVTGDVLGATMELSEMAFLVAAALAR